MSSGKANEVEGQQMKLAEFFRSCGSLLATTAFVLITSVALAQQEGGAGGAKASVWSGAYTAAQAKRNLRTAIENVASRLGNTATICRKCYVHPEVLTSYLHRECMHLRRVLRQNEQESEKLFDVANALANRNAGLSYHWRWTGGFAGSDLFRQIPATCSSDRCW